MIFPDRIHAPAFALGASPYCLDSFRLRQGYAGQVGGQVGGQALCFIRPSPSVVCPLSSVLRLRPCIFQFKINRDVLVGAAEAKGQFRQILH